MDTAILTTSRSEQMSLSDLHRTVERVMRKYESFPEPVRPFTMRALHDPNRDCYTLLQLSRPHGLQVADTIVHLEIRNAKVYVEADATEHGIGNDLVAAGVPKAQIVLAFYPVTIREMGEFAVS